MKRMVAFLVVALLCAVAASTDFDCKGPDLSAERERLGLVHALTHGEAKVRETAARRLHNFRDGDTVDTLITTLLTDADVKVRAAAAKALGFIGDKRAWRALLAAAMHKDLQLTRSAKDARSTMFTALRQLGVPESVPALIDLWRQDTLTRRVHIIVSMILSDYARSKFDERAAVSIADVAFGSLLEALYDQHWRVRLWTAYTLSRSKKPEAVDTVRLLLTDPDTRVRDMAVHTVARLEALENATLNRGKTK